MDVLSYDGQYHTGQVAVIEFRFLFVYHTVGYLTFSLAENISE